jgi:hypothetical protein
MQKRVWAWRYVQVEDPEQESMRVSQRSLILPGYTNETRAY